jgi:hypothetical protein
VNEDSEWTSKKIDIESRVGEVLEKSWLEHAEKERKRDETAK